MPRMIDCHVHLCGGGETEYLTRTIRSTLEVTVLKGYAYAKRTLDAGFATIRDVGSPAYMGVSLIGPEGRVPRACPWVNESGGDRV